MCALRIKFDFMKYKKYSTYKYNKQKLDFYGPSVTFVIHPQCPMMERKKKLKKKNPLLILLSLQLSVFNDISIIASETL